MHAVTHGIPIGAAALASGQQEMVDAAHARERIAHASRHAGSQKRPNDDRRIVCDVLFALNHIDATNGGFGGVGRGGGHHVNAPNTASILSFKVATVNGLTR